MCLPRAVVPEIVPVVLAFVYTDRLEVDAENSSDHFQASSWDPGIRRERGGILDWILAVKGKARRWVRG